MSNRLPLVLVLCLPFALNQRSAAQTCNPGNADPSVTICMPTAGGTLTSPLHLQIATNDSAKVDMLQVWYNGVKRWENPVSSADLFLVAENTGPDSPYAIFLSSLRPGKAKAGLLQQDVPMGEPVLVYTGTKPPAPGTFQAGWKVAKSKVAKKTAAKSKDTEAAKPAAADAANIAKPSAAK